MKTRTFLLTGFGLVASFICLLFWALYQYEVAGEDTLVINLAFWSSIACAIAGIVFLLKALGREDLGVLVPQRKTT